MNTDTPRYTKRPQFLVERGVDNTYNSENMKTGNLKWRFWLLLYGAVCLLLMGRILRAEEALRIESLPPVVRQGDVCFVRVFGPMSLESVHGEFAGERFPMAPAVADGVYQGLFGVDMNTKPGPHELKAIATGRDQGVFQNTLLVEVEKVSFKTQRLTLPSSMVDLDKKTLDRVVRERKQLKAALEPLRDERLWQGPFVRPVQGEITTAFGLRRFINEQPRSPHTGVDMRAPEGTPIRATNRGIVVLVDDMFFSGKSVVIDHGWGVFSMYFHLSEVLVNRGDRVATGAVIGRAGSTGRATGPHLHWGVRVNGARVDPLSLVKITESLPE
jgi:murein DD-endopeptidase MepM/ murein hydrolase activator NlpD